MAQQTQTKQQVAAKPAPAQSQGEVAVFQPPRLPYHNAIAERFGLDKSSWKALVEAVFPSAKTVDSVVMALSYCKARNLDPFKKPVHIVPIWDNAKRCLVETVWPGIAELRTTAFRTGQYAGCDEAEFGEDQTLEFTGRVKGGDGYEDKSITVTFPEWCRITVHRELSGRVCKFVGPKVYWLESYATMGKTDLPNEMWQTRARGQIEKCAEAAALRKAFPEELGSLYAAEEVEGRNIDVTPMPDQPAVARPARADFIPPAQEARQETAAPAEPQSEAGAASEATQADGKDADSGEPLDPEAVLQDLIDQLGACSIAAHIDELIDANAELIASFSPPEEATWADAVTKRRAALQKGGKR